MILLVHLIFGAAIGSIVGNIPLALILAFLSHYFLDALPHTEYDIENVEKKQWQKAVPGILKILLDTLIGFLLIFLFSKNSLIIYICAIASATPDSFTVLNWVFKNKILETHAVLNTKVHFLKFKKIPNFWRILSQFTIVIISILLLKL